MIQAPLVQPYVPQQYAQTGNQPGGVYPPSPLPQNSNLQGAIYNYPVTSAYMPNQSANQARFNGVNIEIINPQGQGNTQGGIPQQNMMNNYPYYTNDTNRYNGVNIEILNPQGQGSNGTQQQGVMPAQFYPQQMPPVIIPPFVPQQQVPPQIPQQQTLPPFVPQQQVPPQIPPQQIQQPIPPQQLQQPPYIPQVPPPQIPPQPNTVTPVIDQPAPLNTDINAEAFAGRLKTDDLDSQKFAIEDIADKVKNSETDGPALLDDHIFDGLVDIIKKDTSALPGPTPESLELRERNPEELTMEEQEKAKFSPYEKAEINKMYSLYTISYMQDRLNKELEKRRGYGLELKDLPCIMSVVETVKSDPNPMLRTAAIASLSHIAKPEYKQDLSVIFNLAQDDEDEEVRHAAMEANNHLNTLTAPYSNPYALNNTTATPYSSAA